MGHPKWGFPLLKLFCMGFLKSNLNSFVLQICHYQNVSYELYKCCSFKQNITQNQHNVDMQTHHENNLPIHVFSDSNLWRPFQLGVKSPMITDQHTTGRSVSQLSQLAKLSPWSTLSTKYIITSFWCCNKWIFFFYLTTTWVYIKSLTNRIKYVQWWWKNTCGLS